jgi:hypothetical protein
VGVKILEPWNGWDLGMANVIGWAHSGGGECGEIQSLMQDDQESTQLSLVMFCRE